MKRHLEGLLREALSRARTAGNLDLAELPQVAVEAPADPGFGDFASDVVLRLARVLHEPPQRIAETLLAHLHDPGGWLDAVEVAGPGFVNFRLAPAFWHMLLDEAVSAGGCYGRSLVRRGHASIEVVCSSAASAVGLEHARATAVGDATARVLEAAGYEVEAHAGVAGAGPRVRIVRGADAHEIVPGSVRVTRGGEPLSATLAASGVSPEAVRFFLLLAPAPAPLEVDLGLATRERMDNPFFYVRYAQARVAHALGDTARPRIPPTRAGLGGDTARPRIPPTRAGLGVDEVGLIRVLVSYPEVVEAAACDLEPHRIVSCTLDLARAWHHYYNRHRAMGHDPTRRDLVGCIGHVLESALGLVGATKGA